MKRSSKCVLLIVLVAVFMVLAFMPSQEAKAAAGGEGTTQPGLKQRLGNGEFYVCYCPNTASTCGCSLVAPMEEK